MDFLKIKLNININLKFFFSLLIFLEESFFGAAIHNFSQLLRSLQSGRYHFPYFNLAWGTYESYFLM